MQKNLIKNIVLLMVPVIALVSLINIKVDSGSIIRSRDAEIAKIIVSGKNAQIKYNPSLSNLQHAIVEEQKRNNKLYAKDIVVFGSSRSAEISSKLFSNNSFFNCNIAGANILYYISLYGLYKENNVMPHYLMINIDPWTFHSRKSVTIDKRILYVADTIKPLTVQKELLSDYENGLKYLNITESTSSGDNSAADRITDLIEFFNPSYFQLNLKYINSKMVTESDKDYTSGLFTIRSDGSYSSILLSEIDSNWVTKFTKEFIKIQNSDFFIASDTSSIYFEYFKKLLIGAKKDGVVPIVYISPVNPILFDNLSDKMHVAIEDKIDSFCNANGILLIGSFNPHKYGYNSGSNCWRDGYHPVQSVVNNIFKYHKKELQGMGISLAGK